MLKGSLRCGGRRRIHSVISLKCRQTDQLTQTMPTAKPDSFKHTKNAKKFSGIVLFFLSFLLGHLPSFSHDQRLLVATILVLQGIAVALITDRYRVMACVTLFCGVLALYFPTLMKVADTALLYGGSLGLLFFMFTRSLMPPNQPLISRIAERVHGGLRADVEHYTLALTVFWSIFFAIALLAPLALLVTGPTGAWRWPLSGGTFTCALVAMIAEAGVRRLMIRNFEHVSLLATIRAFRSASAEATQKTIFRA